MVEQLKRKDFVFSVSSKEIKVNKDENDFDIVTVPIQSVNEDRGKDIITSKGQESIVQQLKSGLVPAFPNHGWSEHSSMYAFQSIMGQWVDGEIVDGKTFGKLRLRKNNKDAEELLDLLKQEMPVGFSIGFISLSEREREDGGYEYDNLDLLETSPVGIPCNADAVARFQTSVRIGLAAKGAFLQGKGAEGIGSAIAKEILGVENQMTETKKEEIQENKEAEVSENPTFDENTGKSEPAQEEEDKSEEEGDKLSDKILAIESILETIMQRLEKLEMTEDDDEEEEKTEEKPEEEEKSVPKVEGKKIKTLPKEESEQETKYHMIEDEPKGFSTRL
jgi:hypothetical protein